MSEQTESCFVPISVETKTWGGGGGGDKLLLLHFQAGDRYKVFQLARRTKDIAISFRTAPHRRLMPPSVTGDERRATKRGNTNP